MQSRRFCWVQPHLISTVHCQNPTTTLLQNTLDILVSGSVSFDSRLIPLELKNTPPHTVYSILKNRTVAVGIDMSGIVYCIHYLLVQAYLDNIVKRHCRHQTETRSNLIQSDMETSATCHTDMVTGVQAWPGRSNTRQFKWCHGPLASDDNGR